METTKKTHPLIVTAAAAVLITCGVAVASMTGLLGKTQAEPTAAEQAAMQAGANGTGAPTAPVSAAAPAPAVKHSSNTQRAVPSQPVQVAANNAPVQAQQSICRDCGTVSDIREYEKKGDGSGLGAVAGGVAGALLGNQVGNGNGRTAMTILGAAGGAYAGNAVEKNVKANKMTEVTVRFEDNTSRVFSYNNPVGYRIGDRVKVVNGQLQNN